MMSVLFMMPAAPLTSNHSGAASRYVQNYNALLRLGLPVNVLRSGTGEELDAAQDFEVRSSEAQAAKAAACSWRDMTLSPLSSTRRAKALRGVYDPVGTEFPRARAVLSEVQTVIEEAQPALLWAEDAFPAAVCALLPGERPWLYSHHDILHRVRRIRNPRPKMPDRWLLNICRRAETRVLRRAALVLTGSATDAERLRALCSRPVTVIPTAYEAGERLLEEARPASDLRILHLGSLETTANRVGMLCYLEEAHPEVVRACRKRGIQPTLHIIGDASRVKSPLKERLEEAGAELKGFVPDLKEIMRPFDIAILPYEHDTGYRTKLPLLFQYGQVVVATKAAVAGNRIAGLETVCVLRDRVTDFADSIERLVCALPERERLGRAANAFFQQHFTQQAVEALYRALLEDFYRRVDVPFPGARESV